MWMNNFHPQMRCRLLVVVDQKLLLDVGLMELFDVLLMLFFAPVTWIGDSGFQLRYCVAEIYR